MARRGDPDPLLLQAVSERLARLLAEEGPRRAAEPAGDELAPGAPAVPAPSTEPVPVPPPEGLLPDGSEPPAARRFGRAHLGVVAVVLLLGVLVAGWGLVRARPVALAAPAPEPAVVTEAAPPPGSPSPVLPPPAGSPSGSGSAPPGPTAALVVHVLGAVRRPGLVRLPTPARVQDAVDAAGGFTRTADPGELNLAQLLTDGQQVVIGTRDEPDGEVRGSAGGGRPGAAGGSPGAGADGATGAGPGGVAVLDLNSADATQLEELPGVGPVTATKIVAWREQHGRFSRVEELQEVDGIGPKTYAEIAPHVRV